MKEILLLHSRLGYTDNYTLEDTLNSVMNRINAVFEPSVLVGMVGRWNGSFNGYKYCPDFKGLQNAIGGYDDIVIRQIGTRLYFTLFHHDGRHEMELRRFSDYGYNHLDNVCLEPV